MSKTKIQWTDEVWNPVTGCTPCSPGCTHCYAKRMAHRLAGRYGYPKEPHEFDVTLRPERLGIPLRRKKPAMYFVCSMGDLFHPDVPLDFVDLVFLTMTACNGVHSFQLLTKRPGRMLEYFNSRQYYSSEQYHAHSLPNVHLGVSVENQAAADERIPLLLQAPAAVRFVSVEPCLSVIDLTPYLPQVCAVHNCVHRGGRDCLRPRDDQPTCLDWTICGGESGPGARPMRPDWARSLRDQCQAAGVPFFFKSWGAWAYDDQLLSDGLAVEQAFPSDNGPFRVGKKAAGNLLDGREHHEFPAADGAGNR